MHLVKNNNKPIRAYIPDARKSQSAAKNRFDDSPPFQNHSHKNSYQRKLVPFKSTSLLSPPLDHTQQANSFLQQSIDVNDFSRNQRSLSSHVRVKTETDKLPNFNKRYYPQEMRQLLSNPFHYSP